MRSKAVHPKCDLHVQVERREGKIRIVTTQAFVRSGRSHDIVCHLKCGASALVKAMVSVHGSVQRVPMAKGVGGEEYQMKTWVAVSQAA